MEIKKKENAKCVVLIDSHPIFREGVKRIVDRYSRFCVVGETGDISEGFRIIEKLKPHLVMVEIWLRDKNAVQLIREVKRRFPEIHVIVLTMYHELKYIIQAFGAGATGIFSKETDAVTFLKGCEIVLRGEQYIDRSFSPESISNIRAAIEAEGNDGAAANEYLTAREKEVLCLVAEGFPRKEIARMLYISPKTVENHISRIMKRLCLRNTIELLRWAAGFGLVNLDGRVGKFSSSRYTEAMVCNQ